jgi:hypothetical protein
MEEQKFLDKITEFRILYEKDKTNDYYLIQYLGSILDYIERSSGGFLSDLGRMTLSINIGEIHRKLITAAEDANIKKLPQKDLVRFCLYMTDAYAVVVMFAGMVDNCIEIPTFLELHPLPDYVKDDLLDLQKKTEELRGQFKSIMDKFSQYLEGKYRTIYNGEKQKGFVKPIFNEYHINTGSGLPKELAEARECK